MTHDDQGVDAIAMTENPRPVDESVNAELSEGPSEPKKEENPQLASFMHACQTGNLETVAELISSKQVLASDTGDDQVTGLHWAAINNRLLVVRYLMENEHSVGDPNAPGGSLRGTPLHWACRNGLVYIVDYFLTATDADPAVRDSQGYHALHLAVHSSNITLVVYIVLSCVATVGNRAGHQLHIDDTDAIGCTALHWAAYQGDILLVNYLLKSGANVNILDKNAMSPLHWGFIRGYKSVLASLLDAGADIFHKNARGTDSFGVARDMNVEKTWIRVLREADRNPKRNWSKNYHWLRPNHAQVVTFLIPYAMLPVMFSVCTLGAGLIIPKLFAAAVIALACAATTAKFLLPVYSPRNRSFFKSPFLAGIFSSTAFWCVVTWLGALLPTVGSKHPLAALMTAFSIVVFSYTFFKALFLNPGFVPVPSDNEVVLDLVRDLIAHGHFDTDHFCVNTFIRKPLRSKYSRFSNRLIARFDHYCPWVYNDIGVRNHKLFMAFAYAVLSAIVFYTVQAVSYFDEMADRDGYATDAHLSCFVLGDDLCKGLHNNHFIFNLTIWCCFQLVWLGFLCVVQTFQILRGLTTWEFSALNARHTPALTHSSLPAEMANGGSSAPLPHPRHNNGLAACAKLLGLDQFVVTAKVAVLSLFNKAHYAEAPPIDTIDVPTDFGWKQNLLDFWFIGDIKLRNLFYLPIEAENNLNGHVVDYYKLYEYPPKHSGQEAV